MKSRQVDQTRNKHKSKRQFAIAELPAPALVTLSSFLEYEELLILEDMLAFDKPLMGECWKEALVSHISGNGSEDEVESLPSSFAQKKITAKLTAKQIVFLTERLEKFKPKTFLLGAIAAHFELRPPFHFFKRPNKDIRNGRLISFHSLCAAGNMGKVDWLSLGFVVSQRNVEIFISTGNDSQQESNTIALASQFILDHSDTEESISANLLRMVEQLRIQRLKPVLEVLLRESSVQSHIDQKELEAFNKRCGVPIHDLVNATRVIVDPPQGSGATWHVRVMEELESKIQRVPSQSSR
jgi:hypothetical protein